MAHTLQSCLQKWGFWDEARQERRLSIRSLCSQGGRHMTRSFCRPCRHPPGAFPFGRFKEPPFRCKFSHPPLPESQFKFQRNFDDEPPQPRGPTAISSLQWAHPPIASSPPEAHPSSSIGEKRYALLHISFADITIQQ